jgi:hypothetical protein
MVSLGSYAGEAFAGLFRDLNAVYFAWGTDLL